MQSLGKHLLDSFCFKGSTQQPLLAPRGMYMVDKTDASQLLVSDTGHNRVFIWNDLPKWGSLYQEPDIILGQENVTDFGRNANQKVAANTLLYPSGIWSDGKKVIVADAWNHRVLIWHSLPKSHGQAADVVIGQPDFDSGKPNIGGVGKEPSARSLHWPYGVCSDGESLWIADTGNRRVLWFEAIPQESYTKADSVIGQPNMTTRDYNNQHALWPYAVKVNRGKLAISDTQFYRTLMWNNYLDAFDSPADIIIGQCNFDDCGQNQLGLFPAQNTLSWTYDTCFHDQGILINDTGNSRVLWYEKIPSENNEDATAVIGKRDFTTGSENADTLRGTENSIYWPFSLSVRSLGNRLSNDSTQQSKTTILGIADTGNHRLVFGRLALGCEEG